MKRTHIKLTTAVALAAALILAGCVAAPQKNSLGEFPVCHTAALDWPTNLTLEQLKDEPIKQLDGGIGMTKEGVPLDLGPQISSEEIEAAAQATQAGKSWLEFYPDTKIIRQTSDSIQLSAAGFRITLTVMAYGDFNHDGYDDALLCVSHSAIGGTLNYSFNAMLTRTNATDRLRLLK